MKKNRIVSTLLVAALACSMLLFSACGEKAPTITDVTGTTWSLSGGSQGSTKVSAEDMITQMGGEITYTFNDGGAVDMGLAGEVLTSGTWVQDGAKVTVTMGETSADMMMDGDTLSITQGDVVANFTLKK